MARQRSDRTDAGVPLLDIDPCELRQYPDLGQLAGKVRFSPETGRIWLDSTRMVLVPDFVLADQRFEIIQAIGVERARAIFMRIGYYQGVKDAEMLRSMRESNSRADLIASGPQLGAVQGLLAVHPDQLRSEMRDGHFYADHPWVESVEAQAYVARFGKTSYPVCWRLAGYASGIASEFLGEPILFRETECVAMGHAACRGIGKPIGDWGEEAAQTGFLEIEPFVNAFASGRNKRKDKSGKSVEQSVQMSTIEGIVGVSAGFNACMHKLRKVADTDTSVLFLGESGVGKGMFAEALHRMSARAGKPLVSVNCAAIPENLVEAELFGVERGAFTGAERSRPGRFERAAGGTLFLDEVGSLSFTAQGKLLRALQEQVIERVGGTKELRINTRVIAATNTDLQKAVRSGAFREDLFYRLNVFPIHILPLRQRREDIVLLMNFFLERNREKLGKRIEGFTHEAAQALCAYEWPGNIRELENMIERACILASEKESLDIYHLFSGGEELPDSVLYAQDQHEAPDAGMPQETAVPLADSQAHGGDTAINTLLRSGNSLETINHALMAAAIEACGGNLSAAARKLGMSRDQLDYRWRRRNAAE